MWCVKDDATYVCAGQIFMCQGRISLILSDILTTLRSFVTTLRNGVGYPDGVSGGGGVEMRFRGGVSSFLKTPPRPAPASGFRGIPRYPVALTKEA